MGAESWIPARSSSRVLHESSQALDKHERKEKTIDKISLDRRINGKKQNYYYYYRVGQVIVAALFDNLVTFWLVFWREMSREVLRTSVEFDRSLVSRCCCFIYVRVPVGRCSAPFSFSTILPAILAFGDTMRTAPSGGLR
jgi:hypothetical protein